jgi:hypothetical protein
MGFDALDEMSAADIAGRILSEPLPHAWEAHTTDSSNQYGTGIRYYVNLHNNLSQWDHPREGEILDQVSHALIHAPKSGSKIEPFWKMRVVEQDAINGEPRQQTRPIVTDQTPLYASNYRQSLEEIRVPTHNGFPILNVTAIKAFAVYFGIKESFVPSIIWILYLASLCPLPSGWILKHMPDHQTLFTNPRQQPYIASKSHPNDSFFRALIGAVTQNPAWFPQDPVALVALDSVNPTREYFDWSTMTPLTIGDTLGRGHAPDVEELSSIFRSVVQCRQFCNGTQSKFPDVECMQNACSNASILEYFKDLPELLEDVSKLRNVGRQDREQLQSLVTTAKSTISHHIGILRSCLGRMLMTMKTISDFEDSLSLAARVIVWNHTENYQLVLRTLYRIAQIVVVNRNMNSGIFVWQTNMNDAERKIILQTHIIPIVTPTMAPDMIANIPLGQSLLIVIRNVSIDALLPHSGKMVIPELDDEDDEFGYSLDKSTFEDLSSKYFPGSHIVTRGILDQLRISDLMRIESVLSGLVDSFNDKYVVFIAIAHVCRLVRLLDEREKVLSEVATKRNSIYIITGQYPEPL